MKLTKKKALAIALVISLAAIISMGSLAWFNAQDTTTNKFLVATSTDDTADEVFSVNVIEYDKDGNPHDDTTGITYDDILPGDALVKDARVQNTGYYDQFIKVTVTISDATAWSNSLGTDFNDATLEACFAGFDKTKWNHISTNYDAAAKTVTVVMYYNEILPGKQSAVTATDSEITVFTGVNIPTSLDRTQAAAFNADGEAGFTIGVVADAVQTENLGANAYDAFQALAAVTP